MARTPSSNQPGSAQESDTPSGTPGVARARDAASDTMTAVGDVLGATVQAAADVGEDVVHGVGRVALTAVDETAHVLAGVASGVRGILAAGFAPAKNNAAPQRRRHGESDAPNAPEDHRPERSSTETPRA